MTRTLCRDNSLLFRFGIRLLLLCLPLALLGSALLSYLHDREAQVVQQKSLQHTAQILGHELDRQLARLHMLALNFGNPVPLLEKQTFGLGHIAPQFSDSSMRKNHLQSVLLLDNAGHLKSHRSLLNDATTLELGILFSQQTAHITPLMDRGIVLQGNEAWLYTSTPISSPNSPGRQDGFLVLLRPLDSRLLADFNAQFAVNLRIESDYHAGEATRYSLIKPYVLEQIPSRRGPFPDYFTSAIRLDETRVLPIRLELQILPESLLFPVSDPSWNQLISLSIVLLTYLIALGLCYRIILRPLHTIIALIHQTSHTPSRIDLHQEQAGGEFAELTQGLNATFSLLIGEAKFSQKLLTAIKKPLLTIDQHRIVHYANQTAIDWLALSEAEVIGQHLDYLLWFSQSPRPLAHLVTRAFDSKTTVDQQGILRSIGMRQDGQMSQLFIVPLEPDNQNEGAMVIIRPLDAP